VGSQDASSDIFHRRSSTRCSRQGGKSRGKGQKLVPSRGVGTPAVTMGCSSSKPPNGGDAVVKSQQNSPPRLESVPVAHEKNDPRMHDVDKKPSVDVHVMADKNSVVDVCKADAVQV
jgi:hypothetical protein